MDSKQGFNGNGGAVAHYEDFEPHFEWAKDESFDTLLVYLPGFPKDKLKIQITSSGKLKISGERLTGQNKWRRFLKELPLEPNCDTNKISAKFEGGILYVKVPKPNPNPNPNPKAQPQEKPTPNPKPTAPTTGDQYPNRKPPQKQEITNAKADNGDTKNTASSPSGSKKADMMVEKKTAEVEKAAPATGGEGSGKTGEKLLASKNVGLVRRTTTLLGEYKNAIVTQKNPRVLVNMLLAVLFVGVLALYAKNILIRSLTKSNGSDHHDEL